MDILISNLLLESIFDIGKMRKYEHLRIFSLITSWSRKSILKADLKWECPYFYSKTFLLAFWSVFKKVKKYISHFIFKMWFCRGGGGAIKKKSEKAKHPQTWSRGRNLIPSMPYYPPPPLMECSWSLPRGGFGRDLSYLGQGIVPSGLPRLVLSQMKHCCRYILFEWIQSQIPRHFSHQRRTL
jgi:hypothetical protein